MRNFREFIRHTAWLFVLLLTITSCKDDISKEPEEEGFRIETEIEIDGENVAKTKAENEMGWTTGDGIFHIGDRAPVAAYAKSGYELVRFYAKDGDPLYQDKSFYDVKVVKSQIFKAEFQLSKMKVGDIYFSDFTFMDAEKARKNGLGNKIPIGVVAWLDSEGKNKGWIISLASYGEKKYASNPGRISIVNDFSNKVVHFWTKIEVDGILDLEGRKNTKYLLSLKDRIPAERYNRFDALDACINHAPSENTKGLWYMPSIGQLYNIRPDLDLIFAGIRVLNQLGCKTSLTGQSYDNEMICSSSPMKPSSYPSEECLEYIACVKDLFMSKPFYGGQHWSGELTVIPFMDI